MDEWTGMRMVHTGGEREREVGGGERAAECRNRGLTVREQAFWG